MSTFYRDFHGDSAIARAIDFCAKRGSLGHNTRRIRLADDWTRVFFSASFIDIERAREAEHEDRR